MRRKHRSQIVQSDRSHVAVRAYLTSRWLNDCLWGQAQGAHREGRGVTMYRALRAACEHWGHKKDQWAAGRSTVTPLDVASDLSTWLIILHKRKFPGQGMGAVKCSPVSTATERQNKQASKTQPINFKEAQVSTEGRPPSKHTFLCECVT